MILIDSDIIIWILRGDEDIRNKFEELARQSDGQFYITPIQLAEIYAGIRENERAATELFLDSLLHISIDKQTGQLAGNYLNQYKKSHGVTISDGLIAACVKKNNLRIWTLNKKHYPMFRAMDFV
jgi:predicted nucleic acid-binding protein